MRFSSRVLLCIIGVLRNASIWGDASIDTVSAHMYGYSKNKISDSRNCERPCKFGAAPRRCVFDFFVRETLIKDEVTGANRTVLAINDQSPGPRIQVCLNDIVVVNVANKLLRGGAEFGIHWRGVAQKGSPFMDGVPMITQCPITSGTTFAYAFRADQPGTHLYHAHDVSQQLEGLYGALIVKQPYPLEPGFPLYDYDRIPEHLFVVAARSAKFGTTEPGSLIIGNGEKKRCYVTPNARYRMRAINAAAIDCPIAMKVQGHQMIVIASDGRAARPALADSFILYPGERVDFILNANQPPSLYELQLKGMLKCDGLYQTAQIIYENINVTYTEDTNEVDTNFDTNILSSQSLSATAAPPPELTVSPISQQSVYLQVDKNSYKLDDKDSEYRYLSDAMPVPPFYPAELTLDNEISEVVQINGKSFAYPNSPMLTQPEHVLPRTICPVGYESKSKYFECTQTLDVEYKSTLELIIVDEGFGSDTPKTFHLHGNPMHVLATSESYENPISVDFVKQLDSEGKIERNFLNPLKKDTVVVPNKGFVVVRTIADNVGVWLLECRGCGVASLPTSIVLRVNAKLPEKILNVLPKCGNYKPADTLLN